MKNLFKFLGLNYYNLILLTSFSLDRFDNGSGNISSLIIVLQNHFSCLEHTQNHIYNRILKQSKHYISYKKFYRIE